jgi:hypothetical protein
MWITDMRDAMSAPNSVAFSLVRDTAFLLQSVKKDFC